MILVVVEAPVVLNFKDQAASHARTTDPRTSARANHCRVIDLRSSSEFVLGMAHRDVHMGRCPAVVRAAGGHEHAADAQIMTIRAGTRAWSAFSYA
jgi:hypothetical protein